MWGFPKCQKNPVSSARNFSLISNQTRGRANRPTPYALRPNIKMSYTPLTPKPEISGGR